MKVLKVRKKPIEVEAVQYEGSSASAWEIIEWVGSNQAFYKHVDNFDELYVQTLEGTMHVSRGDYVIRGVEGEFYPCKPDIFDKSYEVLA